MKYYAVRNGRKVGVYTSWTDCEAQVKGFANASFKSFNNLDDANAFVKGEAIEAPQSEKKETVEFDFPENYAFTDGSFNGDTKVWGYGGFIVVNGTKIELKGCGTENAESRNICGETAGATAAINKAIELGLHSLTIYYDYMGVEMWATGEWKAKTEVAKKYVDAVQKASLTIELSFVHVKGHTGIPGNEEADRIAKSACGVK